MAGIARCVGSTICDRATVCGDEVGPLQLVDHLHVLPQRASLVPRPLLVGGHDASADAHGRVKAEELRGATP